jgi:hypothetical protein
VGLWANGGIGFSRVPDSLQEMTSWGGYRMTGEELCCFALLERCEGLPLPRFYWGRVPVDGKTSAGARDPPRLSLPLVTNVTEMSASSRSHEEG